MSKRFILAAVIYPMVNAVLFGFGAIVVLTFLHAQASLLLPIIIAIGFVLAIPISLIIAPKLSAQLSYNR